MMSYPGGVISLAAKRGRRGLGWAVVLGSVLALGLGCGLRETRYGGGSAAAGNFRWAVEDTSRMIRNAHYFKLMGQPELALKELEALHRQDPGNLKVTDALAQLCEEVGLSQRAQQLYQEGLALDPNNPVLQNNLGFSYYLAGNWRQAEASYRKILACQPNYAAARNNLGLLLCRQGRQEEARRLWQEAEGEAAAAHKMAAALTALGMAGENRYAQETRPHPPVERQPGTYAGMAAGSPGPSRFAADLIDRVDPAAHPGAPVPGVGSLKAAKALPATPDGPAPEVAAPKAPADREIVARSSAPRNDIVPTAGNFPDQPPATSITARELVETTIAVLNGNGIPHGARDTRSRLSQEGFNVVSIANYHDFGVGRTVIYYRPEAKSVAALLNNKFFPKADIEPAPQLAGRIAVKVILGHDLWPQQHAEVRPTDEPKPL